MRTPPTVARPAVSPGGNSYLPPDNIVRLLGIYEAACPWCLEMCIWEQHGPSTQRGPYSYSFRCDCWQDNEFSKVSEFVGND